jgi:hypothetical protein
MGRKGAVSKAVRETAKRQPLLHIQLTDSVVHNSCGRIVDARPEIQWNKVFQGEWKKTLM